MLRFIHKFYYALRMLVLKQRASGIIKRGRLILDCFGGEWENMDEAHWSSREYMDTSLKIVETMRSKYGVSKRVLAIGNPDERDIRVGDGAITGYYFRATTKNSQSNLFSLDLHEFHEGKWLAYLWALAVDGLKKGDRRMRKAIERRSKGFTKVLDDPFLRDKEAGDV